MKAPPGLERPGDREAFAKQKADLRQAAGLPAKEKSMVGEDANPQGGGEDEALRKENAELKEKLAQKEEKSETRGGVRGIRFEGGSFGVPYWQEKDAKKPDDWIEEFQRFVVFQNEGNAVPPLVELNLLLNAVQKTTLGGRKLRTRRRRKDFKEAEAKKRYGECLEYMYEVLRKLERKPMVKKKDLRIQNRASKMHQGEKYKSMDDR